MRIEFTQAILLSLLTDLLGNSNINIRVFPHSHDLVAVAVIHGDKIFVWCQRYKFYKVI